VAFNISRKNNFLNISFPAALSYVDRAADETKKFLSSLGLERYAFNVVLGLREAMNNAVMSGCNQNQTKTITYHLQYGNDRLIMTVEDEGDGFDWQQYLGKEPPAHAESGRGLPIMEEYFEMIWFNEKGNKVVLVKLL